MYTYAHEKKDNIDLKANEDGSASSLITAKIAVMDTEDQRKIDGKSIKDVLASCNTVQTVEELLGKDQPDLAIIVAILVSTGWNLNDDIFVPAQVWDARLSPLHKPMNDNHDASKILGHIVQSRPLDKDGNEIELADDESPPAEFDIEIAGVLYKAFPALTERIDEIIAKAKTGDIYVSMEAWFTDFGYGIIDPDTGHTKLIERNETTAFLTKHLRAYGGSGHYQEHKIGRVLKNIVFGAQGFVDQPANPESVIKVAASRVFVDSKLSEGGVGDVNEDQVKELQGKLDDSVASEEDKTKEIDVLQKKVEDLEKQVASLTTDVEDMSTKADTASEQMSAVTAEKDELQKRAEGCERELETIRKAETARERLVKLSDVKKIDDEDATLAELQEMTDETFAVVLKYAGEVKSSTEDKTEPKQEVDETAQAKVILDSAKVVEGAEFKVANDDKDKKTESWVSMANKLMNHKENEEGGE